MPCKFGQSCTRRQTNSSRNVQDNNVIVGFGKPPEMQPCLYAHEETSLIHLMDFLDSAKSQLDICVYTITCDQISARIEQAIARGVNVRIITDAGQLEEPGSDVIDLKQKGAHVRTNNKIREEGKQDPDRLNYMHHKFCLIDRRTLLNGSFNWTRRAVLGNNENILVTEDEKLVSTFQKEFEKLWELFKEC
eukprot:TRINITY_DN12210_c0_g1_i1.p1 TRINITY_DN12210_c0_g1~~TRINITY_DN12210_c0_g1_i1.p1  ORF type:complete len:206 (-),score=43.20 TRINITY_DN12210_c0_g1_i1:89-661(-)